jgi:hypothetical protein
MTACKRRPLRVRAALIAPVALCIAAEPGRAQQQLGTKVMGGLGIDAGTQGPPGFFVLDRALQFTANKVRGRNGEVLPIQGLDIRVRANALGVAYTFATRTAAYLTAGAAVPVARVSINSDNPVAAVDRWGLGDLFVQPVKAGWRNARSDIVAGYSFFAPTGKFEPGGGSVGRGFWTHQLSLGGAMYADTTRTSRASALMSYELNQRMRGIDITRGNLLTIQGGAGANIFKAFVAGVAGYALWQVGDDRGADLPPALIGVRTRSFGLGPEIGVVIPSLRLRGEFRYEWDFGVRARPQGQVAAGALGYQAWSPTPPSP